MGQWFFCPQGQNAGTLEDALCQGPARASGRAWQTVHRCFTWTWNSTIFYKHSDHVLLCSAAHCGSLSPLRWSSNFASRLTKPLMSWLWPHLLTVPSLLLPQAFHARWNMLPVSTCLRSFVLCCLLLEWLCTSYLTSNSFPSLKRQPKPPTPQLKMRNLSKGIFFS